jgi:hypothetical protein
MQEFYKTVYPVSRLGPLLLFGNINQERYEAVQVRSCVSFGTLSGLVLHTITRSIGRISEKLLVAR